MQMQTTTSPAAGTDELPADHSEALAWSHYITPAHARALHVQAAQWREETAHIESGGYVLVHEREVTGWTCDIRETHGWLAGCIAVPSTEAASFFIAVGGDRQNGAEKWMSLDIREKAARPAPVAPAPVPPAPKTARQSLIGLVTWALANRFCSTAETIRALLLSLYNGSENQCDLSAVQLLDTTQRRVLCAILMGIGRDGAGNFYDHEIRETFIHLGGESALRWFLGELSKDVVAHMMASARRSMERRAA